MSEQAKWKIVENSWSITTIEDADGNEICRLDLERFPGLNEDNQAYYEQIQRQQAELIANAPVAHAQGRREGLREAASYCRNEADRPWSNGEISGYDQALYETAVALESLAQQIGQAPGGVDGHS